jgi:hypothetical protein
MKIYNYHPEYKFLISDGIAQPSPLDPPGVWLIPAHATEIEPPEYSEGFIPVFNNNSWEVIEDKRGVYYDLETFEMSVNDNPHQEMENVTRIPPPQIPEGKTLKWDNEWILEDIPIPPELTPLEKLEKSGLTIEELKTLLGLST